MAGCLAVVPFENLCVMAACMCVPFPLHGLADDGSAPHTHTHVSAWPMGFVFACLSLSILFVWPVCVRHCIL